MHKYIQSCKQITAGYLHENNFAVATAELYQTDSVELVISQKRLEDVNGFPAPVV
jgi:hypothetical protein